MPQPTIDASATWTRTDVARYLKCSPAKVDRMRRSGELPHFRVGSHPRFRAEDVIAFAGGRTVTKQRDDFTDFITKLVDQAPPLSPAQRDALATLLVPVRSNKAP